jgi:hypothetical protein
VKETPEGRVWRAAGACLRDGLGLAVFLLALHAGGWVARVALWAAAGWAGVLLLGSLLCLLGLALGVPPPGDDDDDEDGGGRQLAERRKGG